MATFKRGPGNFVAPNWMVQPIINPSDLRSEMTVDQIHRALSLARTWKLDADFTWTGTEPGYAKVATATFTNEPFEALDGTPANEIEIDTVNWGAFGLTGLTGHYGYEDGAVDPDRSLLDGFFGYEFEWSTSELLNLRGWFNFSTINVPYDLVGGVSEANDGASFPVRSYSVPIDWNASPFYGTISIDDGFSEGDKDVTFVVNVTITPTLYWGYDGVINTLTGAII